MAWAAAGAPEGTPGVLAEDPSPPPVRSEADIVARAADPYTADPARPDDYRCFTLDAEFPAETYVIGTDVRPDVVPIVHHVLVYVVPQNRLADLQRLEDADPGPGYSCLGSTGLGTVGPMAA